MNEYLNYFVAARISKASAAQGELALVIPLYRIDKLSRSFPPAAVCLWNLLQSDVFSGNTLSS